MAGITRKALSRALFSGVFLTVGATLAQDDLGQDYGESCPGGTLTGQDPLAVGGNWHFSDHSYLVRGYIVCESFPPPGEPPVTGLVGAIAWQAVYTGHHSGRCDKDHRFMIKFYPSLSNPDRPDVQNPVAWYLVEPGVTRVIGWVDWPYGPPSPRFLMAATLNPPFDPAAVGGRGWFSIASVAQGESCFARLGPAEEGTGGCWAWRWFEPNLVALSGDVHYCLGGTERGACCDDWSGQCDEDVPRFICEARGRRAGGTCQSLEPPCGQMPGACCLADETCLENQTRAECEAVFGAYWRGPQTTCADCSWIDCPPGAYVEAEPCGANTNPGCGINPPVFERLVDLEVVCGTVWADAGQRDEDWYELVLTDNAEWLALRNIGADLPVRVTFFCDDRGVAWFPPEGCGQLSHSLSVLCKPGSPARIDVTPPSKLAHGSYWIRVAPEDESGPVTQGYPCHTANDYRFELLIGYFSCPNPCMVGMFNMENEPDYCTNPQPDTFNAGCDQFVAPPGPAIYLTDNFEVWCCKSGWYDLPAVICPGDLNCDDVIDFGDINPFVRALANWPAWLAQYPNCPPKNADINGDGMYGGPRGFGDINAFVRLLAGGGGQPVPCSHAPVPTPDCDWWRFEVRGTRKTTSMFLYSEFPLTWELYSEAAGCYAPPLERHGVYSCLPYSVKTMCREPGHYWLRVVPRPGVECGREYVIGLEEFLDCATCEVTCAPTDTPENEACGQHVNDACGAGAMPVPDPYWPNQSAICGTTYSLLQPEEKDEDWYRFDIPAGDNQYLVVVLNADIPLTPWITIQGCQGAGWLVEDGVGCDSGGQLRGFYIDKQYVPGGSHVDLRITPWVWDHYDGWHANPVHSPCETTYRLIAGYSPTPPRDGDFGIQFEELTPSTPPPK